MFNLKKLSIISCLTLVITGCATAPPVVIQPFDTSVTIKGSYDEVWSKAVRYLSTNQISIKTIEKDSGLIALDAQNLSPDLITSYCDAPKTKMLITILDKGVSSGNLLVNDDGGFITATVNIRFQANYKTCDLYGKNCNYSLDSCNSRGTFEKALLGSLQ